MRVLTKQTDFSKGQLSPLLQARIDSEGYGQSVMVALNAPVLAQGPIRRRRGLEYINEVHNSSQAARLIPFRFDEDSVYMLEFGHYTLRIFNESGVIESGGSPVLLSTVYSSTDIWNLQCHQIGLDMYIVDATHPVQVLSRGSTETSWTIGDMVFAVPPTDVLGLKPVATLTPGATTGTTVTFTASAASFYASDVGRRLVNLNGNGIAHINAYTSSTVVTADILVPFDSTAAIGSGDWLLDYSPLCKLAITGQGILGEVITIDSQDAGASAIDAFRTTDVGSFIAVHGGICKIVERVDINTVRAVVLSGLSATTSTFNWTLESPTFTDTRGYPRSVSFYEQRLIFGGTLAQPSKLWASKIGAYDNFSAGGAEDSDALYIDISSTEFSRIEWMAASTDLLIGTTTGINSLRSVNGPLTPSTAKNVYRRSEITKVQRPIALGSEVMFKSTDGKSLKSIYYDYNEDAYKSIDMTLLCQDMFDSPIKDMAYSHYPDYMLYLIHEDGTSSVCTYNREQQVLGWSQMTTDGDIESVANDRTSTWFIVKRTINGSDVRYVERLENGTGEEDTDGYLDSFTQASSVSTLTASGFAHLAGETVTVKVDGAVQDSKVVAGLGDITLDETGTTVVAGLPYTTTITTLPVLISGQGAPLFRQRTRWVEPKLELYKSVYPTVNDQSQPNRDDGELLDTANGLFTGTVTYASTDTESLTIETSEPYPLTVLGVFGVVEGEY